MLVLCEERGGGRVVKKKERKKIKWVLMGLLFGDGVGGFW